jgi:transcriptional regulator with XRE-family HTH domain
MSGSVTPKFRGELVRFRKLRGFSQAELARRAGFDRSYISQLESGARKGFSTKTVLKLASVLQVSADALLGL